jgi:hypothetical protein
MTVILAILGLREVIGRFDRTIDESKNFCLGKYLAANPGGYILNLRYS